LREGVLVPDVYDATLNPLYRDVRCGRPTQPEEISPKEAWPKMEAAALRAAQLDPNLGTAHRELAAVNFICKWDWVSTENEIKRAIELEPNEAEAYFLYSMYLRTMHRFDEALKAAKRAEELDPLSPGWKSSIAPAALLCPPSQRR
jgi:tetratricopeptide (TPR) repeat protein